MNTIEKSNPFLSSEKIQEQRKKILEHLKTRGHITDDIARTMGIRRLSARINELREILKDTDNEIITFLDHNRLAIYKLERK